jgi:hypothetical protein
MLLRGVRCCCAWLERDWTVKSRLRIKRRIVHLCMHVLCSSRVCCVSSSLLKSLVGSCFFFLQIQPACSRAQWCKANRTSSVWSGRVMLCYARSCASVRSGTRAGHLTSNVTAPPADFSQQRALLCVWTAVQSDTTHSTRIQCPPPLPSLASMNAAAAMSTPVMPKAPVLVRPPIRCVR